VTWAQQAYLKASNPAAYDCFGISVALSSDGNLLAVGAEGEVNGAPHPQMGPAPSTCSRERVRPGRNRPTSSSNHPPACGARCECRAVRRWQRARRRGAGRSRDHGFSRATSGAAYVFTRAGRRGETGGDRAVNAGGEVRTRVPVSATASGSSPRRRPSAATRRPRRLQNDETDPGAGPRTLLGLRTDVGAVPLYQGVQYGYGDGFGMGLAISGDGATVAIARSTGQRCCKRSGLEPLRRPPAPAYSFQ